MEHTSNPVSPKLKGGWEVEEKGGESGGLKIRLRASKINKNRPQPSPLHFKKAKYARKLRPNHLVLKMEDKIDELKFLITSQHTNTRAQIDNANEPLKGDLKQFKDTTASIPGECEENRAHCASACGARKPLCWVVGSHMGLVVLIWTR